jgi:hypothetical protein
MKATKTIRVKQNIDEKKHTVISMTIRIPTDVLYVAVYSTLLRIQGDIARDITASVRRDDNYHIHLQCYSCHDDKEK